MVGMGLVGERRFDVAELEAVESSRRGRETGRELACLLREVIAIEAVEHHVAIAVLAQERLPCLPGRRQRVGASASTTITFGR